MAANVQVVLTLAESDPGEVERKCEKIRRNGGTLAPSVLDLVPEDCCAVVGAEVIRVSTSRNTLAGSVSVFHAGGGNDVTAGGGGGSTGTASVISHAPGCAPDHEHGWHGCLEPNCNCGVVRSNG